MQKFVVCRGSWWKFVPYEFLMEAPQRRQNHQFRTTHWAWNTAKPCIAFSGAPILIWPPMITGAMNEP